MHGTFSTYIWDGISPNWMPADIFRKTVFICLAHAVAKWLAAPIFPHQEKRNIWAKYCFGHVYQDTDTEAKCCICCADSHRHSACLPKPAWKRWIVVFCAIKRLPKFSIAAAAHITDCTRLCKDWAQAPFYHKWNDTAWLLHSLTSGSARMARRSLLRSLRRDDSFRGPW